MLLAIPIRRLWRNDRRPGMIEARRNKRYGQGMSRLLLAVAVRRAGPLLVASALLLSTALPGVANNDLPLPRFVTIEADEANLRTGPGTQYPIEWVYVRPGLPVEVIREYDTWRQVRDHEGVVGWLHGRLLSGRRGVVVLGLDEVTMRRRPDDGSRPVARVEAGAQGRLLRCPDAGDTAGDWCFVEFSERRGWLTRDQLWGVYPFETFE